MCADYSSICLKSDDILQCNRDFYPINRDLYCLGFALKGNKLSHNGNCKEAKVPSDHDAEQLKLEIYGSRVAEKFQGPRGKRNWSPSASEASTKKGVLGTNFGSCCWPYSVRPPRPGTPEAYEIPYTLRSWGKLPLIPPLSVVVMGVTKYVDDGPDWKEDIKAITLKHPDQLDF